MTTIWPEYTTIANLKAYGDSLSSKDDALLLGLIKSFSIALERYLGQSFLTQTVTQYGTFDFHNARIDRDGFLMFYPQINPITAVSALQYRLKGGGTTNWQYLNPANIEVDNRDAGPMIRVTSPDFSYYRLANASIHVQANLTGGLSDRRRFAARFRVCCS
jgi:hypothetical protein